MSEASGSGAVASVRAVRRAAAILKSFIGKPQQTLAEVCAATDLDKGTTRRLILTLMDERFLVQDPGAKRYRLGPIFRRLAANAADDAVITAMNAGLAKAIENEKFKAYCESALVNPSVMTPEETEAYYTEQFDVYKGYLADFIQ